MKLINSIQIVALTILTSSLSFAQTGPTATTTTKTVTTPIGDITTTQKTTTNAKTGNTMILQKQSITIADGTVTKISSSKSIIENNGTGSTIAQGVLTPGTTGTGTTTIGATGATAKKN